MSYKLKFLPSALKEWDKLGAMTRGQFKKKLKERLENPEVIRDRLRSQSNYYKIKLRSSGYRLVYEVDKKVVILYVISVGKREGLSAYRKAKRKKERNDPTSS